MDNKAKIILILIILVLIIGGIFYLTKDNEKETSNDTTKITITFNTDGGSTVENMEITKGESFTLPTTTKEGYNFIGWYNGETEFKETSVIQNSLTLTARWEEVKDVLTIIFDSRGGNEIEPMTIQCENDSATITNLPVPKKGTSNFMTWEDKFGTPILNEALIECGGELNLYAVWE